MKILPCLLIVDSINKIALFLIAAYKEAYQKKPNQILVIIAVICSSGLPISPLFFVKVNILELFLKQNLLLDFIIILLSSVGSLFYHYKMIKILLLQKQESN